MTITGDDAQRPEAAADPELWKNYRNRRFIPTQEKRGRSAAERDSDRILYSAAFRRLGGVTQVVAVSETQLFHNRMSHSLKVAQIGRRLAQLILEKSKREAVEKAGGIDPEVVYAAALAHDLGHPPFGHIAENELQQLLGTTSGHDLKDQKSEETSEAASKLDSFEGNAQTFRIVTKLAFRSQDESQAALNLTRATLAATLKYPWYLGQHPEDQPWLDEKWGAYGSEKAEFEFARRGIEDSKEPPVEATLMDWADDIAYAVHDVEDFYRAGLIPLDRLDREGGDFIARASVRLSKKGIKVDNAGTVLSRLWERFLPKSRYQGTREDQVGLHTFATNLITRYLDAVTLLDTGRIRIDPNQNLEVNLLKQLTWYYMIDNPALATLQWGQRRIIRTLFEYLVNWVGRTVTREAEIYRLPAQLRELLYAIRSDRGALEFTEENDAVIRIRAVVDYISSLTEVQAMQLYQRLTGPSGGSALEGWLRT